MQRFNEDTFIALVTDPSSPVDAATAYAASIDDAEPKPASRNARLSFNLGLLVGAILFALYLLLW